MLSASLNKTFLSLLVRLFSEKTDSITECLKPGVNKSFTLMTRTERQNELLEIRKNKLKGKFIRSRAKWIEEGKQPTKYFCNMESRNFTSKLIYRIELDNGKVITDQT